MVVLPLLGSAGDTDGYAVPHTRCQKIQHFSRGTAAAEQLFPADRLLIDDPDADVHANFGIDERRFVGADTDIFLSGGRARRA